MNEKVVKTVNLAVFEAYKRDVGRGVIRVDYDTMDDIEVSTGDVVSIKGKRLTVAKCFPLYPSDEGKKMIRADGLVRNNVGVGVGDRIDIEKIKAVEAENITVVPLECIPPIDERYLADALESVPVLKGDSIMIPYFGGRLSFQILEVLPISPAIISTNTIFKILETKEKYRQYSKIARSFIDEEKKLTEELHCLVKGEYTEDLGDKILAVQTKLDKLMKVKKTVFAILDEVECNTTREEKSEAIKE